MVLGALLKRGGTKRVPTDSPNTKRSTLLDVTSERETKTASELILARRLSVALCDGSRLLVSVDWDSTLTVAAVDRSRKAVFDCIPSWDSWGLNVSERMLETKSLGDAGMDMGRKDTALE